MTLVIVAVVVDLALLAAGAAALGFVGRGRRGLLDTYGWILLRRDVGERFGSVTPVAAHLFALLIVAVAAGTTAALR